MDSVNSPQANTPQVDATKTTPTAPTGAQTSPAVQEAEVTVNLPHSGSSSLAKPFLIGLAVLFVLVVVGIIGNYFLISKYANSDSMETVPTIIPTTTKVLVSPTPKSEKEEVDQLDTTFPTSEVNGIQTDIKAL